MIVEKGLAPLEEPKRKGSSSLCGLLPCSEIDSDRLYIGLPHTTCSKEYRGNCTCHIRKEVKNSHAHFFQTNPCHPLSLLSFALNPIFALLPSARLLFFSLLVYNGRVGEEPDSSSSKHISFLPSPSLSPSLNSYPSITCSSTYFWFQCYLHNTLIYLQQTIS